MKDDLMVKIEAERKKIIQANGYFDKLQSKCWEVFYKRLKKVREHNLQYLQVKIGHKTVGELKFLLGRLEAYTKDLDTLIDYRIKVDTTDKMLLYDEHRNLITVDKPTDNIKKYIEGLGLEIGEYQLIANGVYKIYVVKGNNIYIKNY